MLNLKLIEDLYSELSIDKKDELKSLLFGKSRQSMAYFSRRKDISFSKIEILADFYHMPVDYFRKSSNAKAAELNANSNYKENTDVNTNLLLEIDSLKKQKDFLEREVSSVKDTLASKEETNLVLKDLVASLKGQIEAYKLRIEELEGKR